MLTPEQRSWMRDAVKLFFNGDQTKVEAWWTTPNPMLGGVIPWIMCIDDAHEAKLYAFIRSAVDLNRAAESERESHE